MAMKKRRNGEGTFYFDEKRERWIGQISVLDSNGNSKRKKVYGKTQREAQKSAKQLIAMYEAGARSLDRNMTIMGFGEYWLNRVLPDRDLADSTKSSYAFVAKQYVFPVWGSQRLCDLRVMDVENGLGRLVKQGLHHGTVKQAKSALSQIFIEAMRQELVTNNPVRSQALRMPKLTKSRQPRAMSHEEGMALIETTKGKRIHGPIVIGILSGLRPGEILALRWEDLDLTAEHSNLRVIRSKTAAGKRTVPLVPLAVDVLKQQRAFNLRTARSTNEMWSDDGFVFPSAVGSQWDYANFLKVFKEACVDAGIGDWAPHEMRHTAASWLFDAGVSPHEVTRQLGHTKISTTFDIYGHQIHESNAVREAFDRIVPIEKFGS
jgi:integrase